MSRVLVWLLLLFIAPSWSAAEGGRTIRVAEHAGVPPLDPADLAWTRAPATRVALYPQATAPGGPGGAVLPVEARALHGAGRLAVRLAWPDAHENSADTLATHRFADAVAVQFAPAGKTLPYVGMGEPGQPVQIWFWRAGQPAQRLAGQGFGSLARSPGAAPEARARRTAGGWEVVLRGEAGARPGAADRLRRLGWRRGWPRGAQAPVRMAGTGRTRRPNSHGAGGGGAQQRRPVAGRTPLHRARLRGLPRAERGPGPQPRACRRHSLARLPAPRHPRTRRLPRAGVCYGHARPAAAGERGRGSCSVSDEPALKPEARRIWKFASSPGIPQVADAPSMPARPSCWPPTWMPALKLYSAPG